MSVYLFRVDEVFSIPRRGIVLAPGIAGEHRVRAGALIELRQPDGTILRTSILAIEMISHFRDMSPLYLSPILIDGSISVVPETEVWLLDEQ